MRMPHPVERLLKINKDVVDVLLVLAVLLTRNSDVEDVFCGNSSTSKASLLLGYDLLFVWLQSLLGFQNDFQHEFAPMTDETGGSVVLTGL